MLITTGDMGFNRRSWAAAFFVALLAGLGALYVTRPARLPPTEGQPFVGRDLAGNQTPNPMTADDVGYQVPRDRIRAIDAPAFMAADKAGFASDQMPVIGVAVSGIAKAYPIPILSRVEIVNDEIAGQAIAVTW